MESAAKTVSNYRSDIAEMDTRLVEANALIDDYFSATFKPSSRLIQEHRRSSSG